MFNTESQSIKPIILAIHTKWLGVFFMALLLSYFVPTTANASFFSGIYDFIVGGSAKAIEDTDSDLHAATLPLPTANMSFGSNTDTGGGDISITNDGEALISESGPSGTLADISDTVTTGQISKYTVRNGDSLGSIAKMYGVTTNTIVWANNLTSTKLKTGQELIILPVSGTIHTVIKGDTLKTIAKKYKADVGEISQFNNLDSTSVLIPGDTIVIPDGEGTLKISGTVKNTTSNPLKSGYAGQDYTGYYIRPIVGGIRTQGLHGYNAVDIGTSVGTTLYAAAAGQVIIAKTYGWNGGYGKYIVISHYNGTQTVYGHLSEVLVNEGEAVYQGQVIGLTGNTGNSTGPHLHFEVRGAKNPLK